MVSSFGTVVVAKLGTAGEYVYLWDKFIYPVVLDSLCDPLVRSSGFVSGVSKPIKWAGWAESWSKAIG